MARYKDRGRKKRKKDRTSASRDKYVLYQECVQEPAFDVEFFADVFQKTFERSPSFLREDFCGTANLSCEWVRQGDDRRAAGYDLDDEPLGWCREHNLPKLTDGQRGRIELHLQDVREATEDRADVISCQNFSPNFFHTRDELRRYFEAAHSHLADQGMIVMDVMGGSEVIEEDLEVTTEKDGYDYVWYQRSFDPITSEFVCELYFRFPDDPQSQKTPVFAYTWRLWSLTELSELLLEAGFSRADVYWEGVDDDGEGDGDFVRVDRAPSEPAWVCYLIGVKNDA